MDKLSTTNNFRAADEKQTDASADRSSPKNLVIPSHHYLDSSTLVIGIDRMKQVAQNNSTLSQLS